jgi:hypothetical protein
VYEIRHSFQAAMEERFTKVVQDALGRTVIAYMSQVHSDPDISAELFVLEPRDEIVHAEHEPLLAHHEIAVVPDPV